MISSRATLVMTQSLIFLFIQKAPKLCNLICFPFLANPTRLLSYNVLETDWFFKGNFAQEWAKGSLQLICFLKTGWLPLPPPALSLPQVPPLPALCFGQHSGASMQWKEFGCFSSVTNCTQPCLQSRCKLAFCPSLARQLHKSCPYRSPELLFMTQSQAVLFT